MLSGEDCADEGQEEGEGEGEEGHTRGAADTNDREVINNVTEHGSRVTCWGNVSFPLHTCTHVHRYRYSRANNTRRQNDTPSCTPGPHAKLFHALARQPTLDVPPVVPPFPSFPFFSSSRRSYSPR